MREAYTVRYRKGSIALSTTRDFPLLRQVFQSGFITHNQLFSFLRLDYCASSRNSFNNRIRRLVKHGLLFRRDGPMANHEVVYSLSNSAAGELLRGGERSIVSSRNHCPASDCLLNHSLDLNEIHLALKRTGLLTYWMPEIEVRSRNDLTSYGYWKYYDAVVAVRIAGKDCKFALEYERTPKASRHYAAIRERIENEMSIATFLYLVPSYEFMSFLAAKFSQCNRPVYLGLFSDLLEQALALPVRRCGSPATLSLSSVLAHGNAQRPGSLFPAIAG